MSAGGRVLGWDLLRGLCAITVACYHLLHWQGVADVHAWGSYGVYLFFVLSGASLAYTYGDRLAQGRFRYGDFLRVRYLRIAPLYLLLMAVFALPWKLLRGGPSADLALQTILNAAFLFGLHDPAVQSLLIGGWSLGIEAVFYLLFPALLWAALRPGWGIAVFVALLAVQAAWVLGTAGAADGYTANAVRYHQVPAFAGYFMGGCLLGVMRRRSGEGRLPGLPGSLLLVAGLALLLIFNPLQQGDELLGARGVLFAALCFAMVAVAGLLNLRYTADRIATTLGDATYGVYLLHPVLYFGLAFVVWPRLPFGLPPDWPLPARIALLLTVLLAAFGLAVLSERRFERPLRDWGKRLAGRPQSDSASMRS